MKWNTRLLQATMAAALVIVGVATAAASERPLDLPPSPSSDGLAEPAHVQQRALSAAERPPLPASREHLRLDYDRPVVARAPLATCDVGVFAAASGQALVNAIRAATPTCINSLFSVSGSTGAAVFPEAKMITVAQAMTSASASYAGNNSTQMMQLILFLRAGYYVQWYNPEVGDYGTALATNIRSALQAFAASPRFWDVNDTHGEILSEYVILIDSSGENASQLSTLIGILDRYGASHRPLWYMKVAVNNVFTALFRGHQLDGFRAAVQQSPGIGVLDSLVSFVNRNRAADVGSDREYLLQNAAGELARFLNPGPWYGYPSTFHYIVHPKALSVLQQFSLTGPGAGIYVRMAGVIDYYDSEHCQYFGLCNFAEDLEAMVLPPAHARQCGPTLRVRSQALTPAQLTWVCDKVSNQEGLFHDIAQTGGVPVPDDFNETLEMVIFHSSTDYETYSGTLFGNDTNNGGMYLEGDPAVPGNQARFLAYEAEWLRPVFEVWNLTHEYVHYLDGRFNWYGPFWVYPLDRPTSAVWFIEGFAEYISYMYRDLTYAAAVTEARSPDRYTLDQILDNDYSSSSARIYQWGYLAVRFMFERHVGEVMQMLNNVSRPGNYPAYGSWLNSVRGRHNAEFREWLVCFAAGNGSTAACGGGEPVNDTIFSDGFDGEGGPPPNPGVEECTAADTRQLDNGCMRSGLAASSPTADVWLFIHVPEGRTRLTFTMSGGTGDADMYHRAGNWPSTSQYDHAATAPGNDDSITITAPAAGWHYLLLKAKDSSFAGVQVSAAWQ